MAKFYIGASKIYWSDLVHAHPRAFYSTGSYTFNLPGQTDQRLHVRGYGSGYIVGSTKDDKEYGRVTYINIKYVPKSIKEAEYPDVTAWFKAVYKFIREFKETAKAKHTVKQRQNKDANALEFYDVDVNLQDVMNRKGFVPTPLSYISDEAKSKGWKTENDRNRAKGWLNLQYTKKLPTGQGRVKLRADVQGKQKVKLMVQGLSAEKMQQVLACIMETV